MILQNCSKLKGSKVFIAHDLTEKQRSENKILRTYLNHKGNRLFMNNIAYTVDDLQNEEGTKTGYNSAPPTPNNFSNRSLEIGKGAVEPIIWKPRINAEEKQTESEIREEEKISSYLEEPGNTSTTIKKKSNKQTAVPLNKEAVKSRLRSNK